MYEQLLWDNLEGNGGERGGFRREGTYVRLWPIHVDVQQKPSEYCKKKKINWWRVRPEHRIKAFPHLKHLCSFPPVWIFWRSKSWYILLYLCVSFHCGMDFQMICNIIPCDQRVCHINNICVVSLLHDLPNGQFMLNMH